MIRHCVAFLRVSDLNASTRMKLVTWIRPQQLEIYSIMQWQCKVIKGWSGGGTSVRHTGAACCRESVLTEVRDVMFYISQLCTFVLRNLINAETGIEKYNFLYILNEISCFIYLCSERALEVQLSRTNYCLLRITTGGIWREIENRNFTNKNYI